MLHIHAASTWPKIQPGISIRGRNSRLIKNCRFSKSSSISLFGVAWCAFDQETLTSVIIMLIHTYIKLSSICLFISSFFLLRIPNHSCIKFSSCSRSPTHTKKESSPCSQSVCGTTFWHGIPDISFNVASPVLQILQVLSQVDQLPFHILTLSHQNILCTYTLHVHVYIRCNAKYYSTIV